MLPAFPACPHWYVLRLQRTILPFLSCVRFSFPLGVTSRVCRRLQKRQCLTPLRLLSPLGAKPAPSFRLQYLRQHRMPPLEKRRRKRRRKLRRLRRARPQSPPWRDPPGLPPPPLLFIPQRLRPTLLRMTRFLNAPRPTWRTSATSSISQRPSLPGPCPRRNVQHALRRRRWLSTKPS